MMNFIKTVATTNGNFAVFFENKKREFRDIGGVFLNKDGHLIRPMSPGEAENCFDSWASDAKSVVPKFHIPFLTIGRELEKWNEFSQICHYNKFENLESAEKRLKDEKNLILDVRKTLRVGNPTKHFFMGKTIEEVCIEYCREKEYEECLRNEDFSDCQVQFYCFNVIS